MDRMSFPARVSVTFYFLLIAGFAKVGMDVWSALQLLSPPEAYWVGDPRIAFGDRLLQSRIDALWAQTALLAAFALIWFLGMRAGRDSSALAGERS